MSPSEPMDIATLNREVFVPHLNSEFTIGVEGTDELVVFTLLSLSELKDPRPESERSGRTPFSIVFGCPSHPVPQGTYQLDHKVLGSMTVFLSPFETLENGHKLEAIFN